MGNSLAIVVLSYNHSQLTTECVESVLQQTSDLPIYLIHNGTEKKQKDFLYKKLTSQQIHHLEFPHNKGFSGGANFGLTEALKKYTWVLFLTNDTLLKKLPSPEIFKALPAGQYAPLILVKRNQKVDSLGAAINPSTGHLFHVKSAEDFHRIQKEQKSSFVYVPGTAFIIDQKTFFNSEGFDESLGTYWEDVDYSINLQKKNQTVGILSDVVIEHKIGKTCHKDTYYTTYLFHRNRLVISWKHSPTWGKGVFTTTIAKDLVQRGFRDLRNRNPKSFRLYLKALSERVKMIKANKKAPQDMR